LADTHARVGRVEQDDSTLGMLDRGKAWMSGHGASIGQCLVCGDHPLATMSPLTREQGRHDDPLTTRPTGVFPDASRKECIEDHIG
jgi:hypothetical protein